MLYDIFFFENVFKPFPLKLKKNCVKQNVVPVQLLWISGSTPKKSCKRTIFVSFLCDDWRDKNK